MKTVLNYTHYIVFLFVSTMWYPALTHSISEINELRSYENTLRMVPDTKELIRRKNDRIEISCEADELIFWSYPKYENKHNFGSSIEIKNFHNGLHTSNLTLHSATFADTGFYRCYCNSTVEGRRKSASTYVYVYDPKHLLAFWEYDVFNINELNTTTFSWCRPTSPNINVAIVKKLETIVNSTDVSHPFSYDPRYGFTVENIYENIIEGNYVCKATNSSHREYKMMEVKLSAPLLISIEADKEIYKLDEPMSIKCHISTSSYTFGQLYWNNDIIETKNFSSNAVLSYNAIAKQSGNVSCETRNKQRGINESLKVFVVGKPRVQIQTGLNEYEYNTVMSVKCVIILFSPTEQINWYYIKNGSHTTFNQTSYTTAACNENNTTCTETILNMTVSESGTLRCEASSGPHKYSSEYNIQVTDQKDTRITYVLCTSFVLLIIFVMISIVVYIRKRRRKQKLLEKMTNFYIKFEKGDIQLMTPDYSVDYQAEYLPYNAKWEFSDKKLKFAEVLGKGAFGIVRKANAYGIVEGETETTVAVKMVKSNAGLDSLKSLVSELKVMIHIGKHPNVVNLLGACTKNLRKGNLLVIVEFCRYGSLQNYLRTHKDKFIDLIDSNISKIDTPINRNVQSTMSTSIANVNLVQETTFTLIPSTSFAACGVDENKEIRENDDVNKTVESDALIHENSTDKHPKLQSPNKSKSERRSKNKVDDDDDEDFSFNTQDLLCWSFQVACGMKYLTSRFVLHGDLAARNILLSDNNIIKICDFGLAMNIAKSEIYYKKSQGPLPIKWMSIESICQKIFSTRSDVWSYGVTLWEIFSMAKMPYPGLNANELVVKLNEGYRLEKPVYATNQIYEVMQECWRIIPKERPSFSELVIKLGNMLEKSTRKHFIDLSSKYEISNRQNIDTEQYDDYLWKFKPLEDTDGYLIPKLPNFNVSSTISIYNDRV